jgi:hypothetical protein
MQTEPQINSPLNNLVGRELSGVAFVRDYIQLQFDDRGLTAINPPSVVVNGETNTPGHQGYRDSLCERIGRTVVETELNEEDRIWLKFDDNSAISISLRSEDCVGPEAAILYVGEETWVW